MKIVIGKETKIVAPNNEVQITAPAPTRGGFSVIDLYIKPGD